MFSHEFQSALALVNVILMQMQKCFLKYSHGDLTESLSFVLQKFNYLYCTHMVTTDSYIIKL